jgi:trk system potassium uptake protein TrkH
MTAFDAINHAMTTLATGGFSTHDASLAFFKEPVIHWLATLFMVMSSLPLLLYAKMVKTRSLSVWRDDQVEGYCRLLFTVLVILTAWYMVETGSGVLEAARIVSVNAVSIMSTTGYALGDYTLWFPGASGVFFLLYFLNGCTGSTNGGVKMFRIQVMVVTAITYLKQLVSPNQVVVSTFNGRRITGEISTAVLAFMFVYCGSIMLFTVALSFFDVDFITALSAAAQAQANAGPGLGPIIGPAGNFASLPDGAKVLLIFAMLLGRLEFFTILVVFSRGFWR